MTKLFRLVRKAPAAKLSVLAFPLRGRLPACPHLKGKGLGPLAVEVVHP